MLGHSISDTGIMQSYTTYRMFGSYVSKPVQPPGFSREDSR